ncbi:MAG: DUF3526 domain-containing protein [Methylotenera sp.]|nr:DUF3526 domain-containing protein [Methylotenera sp.]
MWEARLPTMLLFVMATLIGVATINAYKQMELRQNALASAEKMSNQDWQQQPDRHPHRVAHFGDFVVKPIHGLSYFEPGILNQSGYLIFLEAHRLNGDNFNPSSEGTSLSRFQQLTPAFILQFILPLMLIIIGYSSITEERQQGTLAILKSSGYSIKRILFAKWCALFLPVAIFYCFLQSLSFIFSFHAQEIFIRLGLMICAHLLYIALWCWIVLLVSSLCKRPYSAFLALLLIWFMTCVLVPRGLANLAQSIYPTHSKAIAEFQAEEKLKEIGDSHNPDDLHFAEFKAKVLAQNKVTRIEDLPFNYNGLLMQEGERLTTHVYQEQQTKHTLQVIKQAEFIDQWVWLSPALALQIITFATSGNDLNHHLRFIGDAENRRYATIQYLNHLHMHEIKHDDDKNQRLSVKRWQEAPRKPIQLAPLDVSRSKLILAFFSLITTLIFLIATSYMMSNKK